MLNESLYRALQQVFKRAKVQKQGIRMGYKTLKDPLTGKSRTRVLPGQGGEDYRVCCPFCGDMRYRLEISYRWNTRDAEGNYFGCAFMRCYNDGCDANRDAPDARRQWCHEQLLEMTSPYAARSMGLTLTQSAPPEPPRPAQLPETCVPMLSLPKTHPAIQYLESEYFDAYKTAEQYQLLFCPKDKHPHINNRIIIPIFRDAKLVGWQARYLAKKPPLKHIPKYYTMPGTPRNQILYNFDRARQFKFAILVEGVTDVWRVGPQCVAAFGCAVSAYHIQLMRATFQGAALMLDPDFVKKPSDHPPEPPPYEVIKGLFTEAGAFPWGSFDVVLGDGVDPGKLDTDYLWQMIELTAQVNHYPTQPLRGV